MKVSHNIMTSDVLCRNTVPQYKPKELCFFSLVMIKVSVRRSGIVGGAVWNGNAADHCTQSSHLYSGFCLTPPGAVGVHGSVCVL